MLFYFLAIEYNNALSSTFGNISIYLMGITLYTFCVWFLQYERLKKEYLVTEPQEYFFSFFVIISSIVISLCLWWWSIIEYFAWYFVFEMHIYSWVFKFIHYYVTLFIDDVLSADRKESFKLCFVYSIVLLMVKALYWLVFYSKF